MIIQRTTPREVKKTDLAWLAGIIDGEGTIGAYFFLDKRSKHRSPRYGIWLCNSEKSMIERSANIMANLGAKVYLLSKTYKDGALLKARWLMWQLQVQKKEDVKIVLEKISPYMVSKKPQANRLLKFFNDYPNLLYGRGNRSGKKNEHFEIYKKLEKDLKNLKVCNLIPVETKRETPLKG